MTRKFIYILNFSKNVNKVFKKYIYAYFVKFKLMILYT